jgi:hypothetical protein
MFLIYSREMPEGPSADEVEDLVRTHTALVADARRKGVLLAADQLKPTATATTVRSLDGQAVILDGPFAETGRPKGGSGLVVSRPFGPEKPCHGGWNASRTLYARCMLKGKSGKFIPGFRVCASVRDRGASALSSSWAPQAASSQSCR